jgi:putative flippase GtrA
MTAPASDGAGVAAFGEFLRYMACSALALASDYGLYDLGMRVGLSYPVAACVGFLAGLAVAYGLSVRWAFKVRAVGNARAEFLIFAGVGIAGLLLTEVLLWAQVSKLGFDPHWAKVGAAGFVFLFNFGVRKALLFSQGARVARSIA